MRKLIGLVAVVISLMFAGSAMAANGADIFKHKCLPCHGAEGAGTAMAPAFQGNKFIKSSSKDVIMQTIKNGRAGAQKHYKKFALSMPPWKAALSDDQISAVIDYLKTIANK